MEVFKTLTSTVVPVSGKDIDTDQIIPASFLTSVSREGYGKGLFSGLKAADPEFPLNQKKFEDGSILLVDHNFGCGSSREHAVWALLDGGFKVVIGKSFADIFSANSAKNGLLLITLPEKEIDKLSEQAQTGSLKLKVNLELQKVISEGREYSFEYNSFRRHCLLNGLDDLDYILGEQEQINKYFSDREKETWFSTLSANR